MKRTNKTGVWFRRLWALVLAVGLVCTLMGTVSAAPILDAVSVPDVSSPKPTVVIQGNVVVDKNKPTGFYELALCVKTARTITDKATNDPVTEEQYAQVLADDEKNGTTHAVDDYDIVNYPFQSAASTARVDLDALTAVTWGSGKPVYSTWTQNHGTAGVYAAEDANYPRGIDMTDPDNLENAALFTSLKEIIDAEAANGNQDKVRVRLDTAKPDEVTNATALIEGYDAATHTALLTLTANSTTTANVVYNTPTPVVVVRFAYDLNRFKNTVVGDPNDPVTAPNTSDFWAGLDRNDSAEVTNGKSPLTCLAAGDQTPGADLYGDSDREAAEASIHQAVWYEHNMESDQVAQHSTQFYYYLGAENKSHETDTQSIQVLEDDGTGKRVLKDYSLVMPHTAGKVVLADKNAEYATPGDPETAKYSFFQNLLTMGDKTLRVELVNAETYRKPTGGGGINILFYDWDDSLIGSLIVDGGDVRSQVEEYVEENLVHPDLRPDKVLSQMGGKLPDYSTTTPAAGSPAETYQNLTNSLARDYTYRGKYAYTVGDPDTVGADGDTTNKARANGEDYPLTNKLDYVFTKRVNTAVTRTVTTGLSQYDETYVLPHKLTGEGMEDAALYPYAYGWAVVEDTSVKNQAGWKVMYDAKKIEDTWTTVGVGELSNVDPDYYDSGSATPKTVSAPAAGSSVVAGSTAYTAPAFLADADPDWTDNTGGTNPKNPNNEYAYQLNSSGSEGYFRFADFSDIDAELAQYQTQSGERKNTLIVKAVYEPGESLLDGFQYRLITKPAYTKWNDKAASEGGAYRVTLTVERSYDSNGKILGTTRIREPAVQQDTTIDAKWITSSDPSVDHDLDNPTTSIAAGRKQTMYSKVETDNGEQITFSLSLSARMNKVDYILVEQYGMNFITGTQRSNSNADQFKRDLNYFVPDNYNYYLEKDSNESDDLYDSSFEDKEGSHGFILYCTLGHMLQQATRHNRGEITRYTLGLTVNNTIVDDTNLRMDLSGTKPTFADNTLLEDFFINAAKACEAHKNDPQYDCWDVNLDCAKLTYHQMQWFILDGGTDIRTVAAADAAKLDFCHYHTSCAAALSTVPDTWDEVITAARAGNDADLKKMTTTAIETITSLRRSANGAQFATPIAFSDAIIDAVAKLDAAGVDPTWGNLQYVILNGAAADETVMKAAGQESYWWYDGSTTAPTLPSVATNKEAQWNFLLQAARDSYKPVPTLKDGTTNDWTSSVKLNLARTPFNRNDTPDQTINQAWINLTHNLVLDAKEEIHKITLDDGTEELEYIYTHTKFADFDAFKDDFVAAVKEAEAQGYSADAGQEPSWEQLQWYIIKKTWESDPDPTVFGQEGFWWKDGNVPLRVSSLTTLLQILEMRDNPQLPGDADKAQAALDKVNAAFFDDTIYLRLDKDGRKKLGDLGKTAADAIAAVTTAKNAGATTWAQIQYYLINGKLDDSGTMSQQSDYYWWKNGGEGNEIDFSTATSLLDKQEKLFAATIYTAFGDPKAIQSVNNAVGSDVFSFLRLIATTGGKDLLDVKNLETDVKPNAHTDADALLADIAAFKTVALAAQSKGEYEMPDVTWYQIQYYILNHTYIAATNADQTYADLRDPEKGYWWYDPSLTARPEPKPPEPEPSEAALLPALEAYLSGGTAIKLSQAEWTATGLKGKTQTSTVALTIANKILKRLADNAKTSTYYNSATGELNLTWVQIQYYVATAHKASVAGAKDGVLTDHATALAKLQSELNYNVTKFPNGVITQ